MKTIICCAVFVWLAAASSAQAAINVFACTPDWGSLVKELAGERADIYVATTADAGHPPNPGAAEPDRASAPRRPGRVHGASLEIGWMPLVRTQSGNEKIQLGTPGYLEVADYVPLIEKPTVVDRSMGDVHPRGNPHIQWGPRQVQLGANEIAKRLAEIDPSGSAEYQRRLADFTARWTAATARWSELGAPLKGVGVIQHHVNYSYLTEFLGMTLVGTLEPKPGVEPTSSHLNSLIQQQSSKPAKLIVRSSYHSPAASEWLAERVKNPRCHAAGYGGRLSGIRRPVCHVRRCDPADAVRHRSLIAQLTESIMQTAPTHKAVTEQITPRPEADPRFSLDHNTLVVLDRVEAGYERPVVGPFSLAIEPGEVVAITGPNGAGKTTLLNAITGVARVFAGTVGRQPRLRVSHHAQSPLPVNNVPLSGRELLALTRADLTSLPDVVRPLLSRRLSELSGGQLQILQVWAGLAAPVDLVLLDEPTNNLDAAAVAMLEAAIKARPAGRAIIIVSHDRRFVEAVASRVTELVRR